MCNHAHEVWATGETHRDLVLHIFNEASLHVHDKLNAHLVELSLQVY
jgi:hypothetical protein